jgi:hypothetical protein
MVEHPERYRQDPVDHDEVDPSAYHLLTALPGNGVNVTGVYTDSYPYQGEEKIQSYISIIDDNHEFG